MHVPLTFGALVALTMGLVVLRAFWPRLPKRLQSFLIACAFIVPAVFGVAYAARWGTSSTRLNAALYWGCIASYEFLLILFTRLRPRWLTSIIAVILILPILSASIFLPLTFLFGMPPTTSAIIGDQIITERTPWGSGSVQTSGTDLTIYYRPSWAPFLLRRIHGVRYFGGQCNAWAAYAVVQPDGKSALMVCPAYPGQSPDTTRSLVFAFQ